MLRACIAVSWGGGGRGGDGVGGIVSYGRMLFYRKKKYFWWGDVLWSLRYKM